jgi:hypothetical protein
MAEYNKDLILAKIKQSFPNEEPERILSILTNLSERNEERIQLAILKVSECDLEKLYQALEAAKADYRDVLAWAEYPEELVSDTWKMNAEEANKIRERDRKQYLDWLKS